MFLQIFYTFSKVFDEYIFAEYPLWTEIFATPLQYRTWEEFMYEILFDVPVPPPNQNPGAAPEYTYIYNLVDVIVINVSKVLFSKHTVQKLQCW